MTPGQTLKDLVPGHFAKLGRVVPAGTLEARRLASGSITFYWRATLAGRTTREPIGAYDPGAPPKSVTPTARGYSITAATRAAEALATQHHAHREEGGHAALREAKRSEAAKARAAKEEARQFTLDALMADYADHLHALGRGAHAEVRSIHKLHVREAWPKVAALPANAVTTEQIADMQRRLIEAGKGRTANKLRSYVRAAYQTAKAARSKASIPLRFKAYAVTSNPAAETAPDETANRADKNPLNLAEMRAYWHAIKDAQDLRGALLRLHLLTGGQRIAQIVALRVSDVGATAITLHDAKGRPGKPARTHVVPLTPAAADALATIRALVAQQAAALNRVPGPWALSCDGGRTHISPTTLSGWAQQAAAVAGIDGFQAKRIRSGVETALAGAEVPQETRGRLQSHGVSGVQARHYDAHDYAAQKLEALATLHELLTGEALTLPARGNVRPLRRAA